MNFDKTEDLSIIRGDARAVLGRLPEGIAQTCVTSPPYFGLREYSVEDQAWGGDTGCEHVWGETLRMRRGRVRCRDHGLRRGGDRGIGGAVQDSGPRRGSSR